MSKRPNPNGSAPAPVFRFGTVDHRLARRSAINEFKKGRIGRLDLCDAHPELMRAARAIGRATETPCPICEESTLVLVTYVFGPRLPAEGKLAVELKDLADFNRRGENFTAYVVEVCRECRWNHLVRVLPLGGNASRRHAG
jgi:hypothetical protein